MENQNANVPFSVDPEKEKVMRNALIQSMLIEYHKFINFCRQLPFQQSVLVEPFKHFDTGMLWLKEGMEYSPLRLAPPAPFLAPDIKKAAPESTSNEDVPKNEETDPVPAQ